MQIVIQQHQQIIIVTKQVLKVWVRVCIFLSCSYRNNNFNSNRTSRRVNSTMGM